MFQGGFTIESVEVVLELSGCENAPWPIDALQSLVQKSLVRQVTDDRFDLREFRDHISRRLPAYACPVFVRLCASLDTTETFKQKKHQLVREGYDPRVAADPMFFFGANASAYYPIDADAYAGILEGSIRL